MEKIRPMLFTTLKKYSGAQLMSDVVAGIIVAIIALPLSIALALASGVGPEQGIYTAIAAGFVISFLGGSQVQIAGPTAAFATIVAGIVARSGVEGLAVATIMAAWFPDQIYPVYDHHRIHLRYRGDHCDRTVKRFLRCHIPGRYGDHRDHAEVKSFCRRFRNNECSCVDRRSCLPGDPHRNAEDHGEDPGILSGGSRWYRDGEIPSITG